LPGNSVLPALHSPDRRGWRSRTTTGELKCATPTPIKSARFNDCFRRSLVFGGQTDLTAGVSVLDSDAKTALLRLVRAFEAFTHDNDPQGEHDFGATEHAGVRYFWKIDYYDLAKQFGSPDAADPAVTVRVLTISERTGAGGEGRGPQPSFPVSMLSPPPASWDRRHSVESSCSRQI
jgi:hypothetical protein